MSDDSVNKEIKDDIVKNFRAKSLEDICADADEQIDEKMKKIKEESEAAFIIDENNLNGELTKCISKLHTYLTKYTEEKMLLNKISRKKDDIHGAVYGRLKKGEQIRFDSKGEIEEWINRDPTWLKINTFYENQKIICEYYQGLIDCIKQKQWAIRNKTDLKKIELGI